MILTSVDYAILLLYFGFVLGIGWTMRKRVTTSEDFLTSGRRIPLWITSLAFLAANLGAQEVIGMCASGAKYGIMTAHFYWLGAIPAMLFVGVFMMPFYYASRARSVPEYLKLRFDEKTRAFNALTFAAMTVFSSGISMYALGLLFQLVLGWSFTASVLLSAAIVLCYTFLGGLTSAIYNEVLQFFLIVLGFAPLAFLAVYRAGGWETMSSRLPPVMTHTWTSMGDASQNPMGVEVFSLVTGLGFVLSFGYWCTDFLVVQRAMAAETMSAARRTPVIAAFPKLLMPFIVIVPGIAAVALMNSGSGYSLPVKGNSYDYDQALTTLMAQFYPTGMLGVGLTALMASFMSGMAGNVTAFNTVWTYDIYQSYIRRNAPDSHYLAVGRLTTVVGIGLSVATAYLAQQYNNIMDLLQLVFGFVNAPLFATFLLGMFWRRTTGHAAFLGLVSGTVAAAATHGLTLAEGKGGWLGTLAQFPSTMAQNFWIAIWAWTICFAVTVIVSLVTRPKKESELLNLVYGLTDLPKDVDKAWYARPVPLAMVVVVLLVGVNLIFLVDDIYMDLRVPSGWFFLLLGVILIAVSFTSFTKAPMTDVNVNLYMGLAMALFGGIAVAVHEISLVTQAFAKRFGASDGIRVFRAPGRVNLIGEHTDYNLGFVLPIALEMACFAAAAPSPDGYLRFYSANVDEVVEWPIDQIPSLSPRDHWSDYPAGVAQQLLRLGFALSPLNVAVYSTVPVGSGLSSSASLEVSCALAMLSSSPIEKIELAKLAQRAEREFVGVPVGIMDQYVSVFGEAGKAILIDCRSLTHEAIPLPSSVAIVAVNSMVKHQLGSSEYPVRVQECAEAVDAIRGAYPAISTLREVSSDALERVRGSMTEKVFRRARHVVTENERAVSFTEAAAQGDLMAMGRLFVASHRSLQRDYEVSAEEVDFLVETAGSFSGVYGARMTGGGFGGCSVNLVSPDRVEDFRRHISAAYQKHFQITPQIYDCIPSEGAREIG